MKTQLRLKNLSALYKVFPDETPEESEKAQELTALRGETVSYQVAFAFDAAHSRFVRLRVESPLGDWIRVREVKYVPCAYPAHPETDDNYLRTAPGLYPDLLADLQKDGVMFVAGQWRSLWVDVAVDGATPAGDFPVTLRFSDYETGEELGEMTQCVTIYDVRLPQQTLQRTEWFHGDCLARYYDVAVFSRRHWEIMENFIAAAAKRGCNMILTPHITPALDTARGTERETVQLVDIRIENGCYSFDFNKLERWVDMCRKAGIRYFEMAHLFTQWGAASAPKIMAETGGVLKRIFGWDTPAVGGAYTDFLSRYLPALTAKLREWGIAENTVFHISDEPSPEQIGSYMAARETVLPYLEGFVIMDALSDYRFYETGAVTQPVCSNDHIETFLEHGAGNVWSYYCTAQNKEVSNRFFSMPSARNRIYGLQLFKYDIKGVLHWGYNFYNSQNSFFAVNPYLETSAGGAFPGGDAFLVYPKADGMPEESIRMMVLDQAMNDLRALQLLAAKIGREKAVQLMEEGLKEPVTFRRYPTSAEWLLDLRSRVNRLLSQL